MRPIRYGARAWMADAYHGWRDGQAGIPARQQPHGPRLPADGPATTPHREALIRMAQDAFEREHLAYRTAVAGAHQEVMAVRARLRVARDKLTWAQAAVDMESRQLTPQEATRRRLGEEHHPDAVIVTRRNRDQRRLIARAVTARADAADAVAATESDLERAEEESRQHHHAAVIRVTRIHEHIHRRLAVYRRTLVRTHPEGAWVNAAMSTVAPEVPGWALPDAYLPYTQEAPALPALPPEEPLRPDEVPDVEIITLRAPENRFGSNPGKEAGRVACYVIRDSPIAAPWHFTVLKGAAELRLATKGYAHGPYIDGDQVTGAIALRTGDYFDFADRRYTVQEDVSQLHAARLGKSDLIAADLWARSGNKTRLSDMSFVQRERTVLAVLGPSGAGKTSTFSALLGELPLQSGKLYFRGLPMATRAREIREQLGFVPQQTELHMSLTVQDTLRYGFGLRSPAGTAEREAAINRVISQVQLDQQRGQLLSTLSGGQLRRVSIALELLTEPSLLMLDEPTSGLDAHMDRVIMTILREYAEKADPRHPERRHTVAVVTHATEHLYLAHQVLVVVQGGAPAYMGPPRSIRKHFGCKTYADLMSSLIEHGPDWAARYKGGRQRGEALTAAERLESGQESGQEATEPVPGAGAAGIDPGSWLTRVRYRSPRARFLKFGVLIRRQVTLIRTRALRDNAPGPVDRLKNRAIVSLPFTISAAMAALAALVTSAPGLGAQPGRSATTALTLLSTLAVLSGQALSYSDIVSEMPIITREHRAGVGAFPVLATKWLVFGAMAIAQAAVITAVFCAVPHRGPQRALITTPVIDLFLGLAALSVAAMSLGMLVSVLAAKLEHAVVLVTGVSVLQIALNGLTSNLSGLSVAAVLAAPFPDRWGVAAAASSTDLRGIDKAAVSADALWTHSASYWGADIAVLGGLSVAYFAVATWRLHVKLRPRG